MYNGPSGPIAFLVHIVVRRPIVSVAIAALGLTAAVGYVNRTPGGPGIHSGSMSVLQRVEDKLQKEHPEYVSLFPAYESAFLEARKKRGSRELPDRVVEDVLKQFGSGISVGDVRANDKLEEAVEKAYFFDSIHRYGGKVDFATTAFVSSK